MTEFLIDIETAGTNRPQVIEYLSSKIAPPKNYKTEDAIRKWWATTGAERLNEVKHSTALNGMWGQVVAIGLESADGADAYMGVAIGEPDLLSDLNDYIDTSSRLIGFNIERFDIPFLYQRALANGMKELALKLRTIWATRNFLDLMFEWTLDRRTMVSLKELAFALGAEVNFDDDGFLIPRLFDEGDDQAIYKHLKEDLRLLRYVWEKMP